MLILRHQAGVKHKIVRVAPTPLSVALPVTMGGPLLSLRRRLMSEEAPVPLGLEARNREQP